MPAEEEKGPAYTERRLNETVRQLAKRVVNDRNRFAFLMDADAAMGFLIGKGVEPQDIQDILDGAWRRGFDAGVASPGARE